MYTIDFQDLCVYSQMVTDPLVARQTEKDNM